MALDLPQPPKRILIIKPSAVGDVVHALPVLNLLRIKWPSAHIAWLVTPACAGILQGHPQLDEIILFERKKLGAWWRDRATAGALASFAGSLADHRFDMVLDLQGLLRSGWMALLTRAPLRIGLGRTREPVGLFYTHRVFTGPVQQHAVDRYLRVARFIGCDGPAEFVFAHDDADRRAVRDMLGDNRPYAVLLPGTNWMTKRWPIRHFAELAGNLQYHMGLRAVIAGGPDDRDLAAQIPLGHNLSGRTTLRQLTALLEGASLVVANDSGPMHIASALGRPLVTLFGPTNPIQTGPYQRLDTVTRLQIACSPCYSRQCSHRSCLEWLTVDTVMQAAQQAVAAGPVTTGERHRH